MVVHGEGSGKANGRGSLPNVALLIGNRDYCSQWGNSPMSLTFHVEHIQSESLGARPKAGEL